MGGSIFGFWFATRYFLRDVITKFPLVDLQEKKYGKLKWFRELEESGVCAHARLFDSLFNKDSHAHAEPKKIEQDYKSCAG